MIESLENSRDELKRVDHLIFVSLKYTRTVDVLKNVLNRMVESYEYAIEAMLKDLEEKNKIFEIPFQPQVRATLILNKFSDVIIRDHIQHYLLFKKILKVENYEKINEYRRHVAMIVGIEGQKIEVNIDFLTEHFKLMKDFLKYVTDKLR